MRNLTPPVRRALNIIASALVVVFMVLVVWLDLRSSFWQEAVILSGIAAGILTFFLTALFLERWMANREHEKWLPVTRLALTDLLHTIADDDASDVKRDHVVPRELEMPTVLDKATLTKLLHQVIVEREEISTTLARWAEFLAASADVQDLMVHVARLAQSLDDVRDAVLTVESQMGKQNGPSPQAVSNLRVAIAAFNTANDGIIQEIMQIRADADES